jgi:transposase
MNSLQRRAAKAHLIAGMLRGQPWQEAAAQVGLQISQATAYRLLSRFRTEGVAGLEDRRHGHTSKLREPVRQWLEVYCRASPACTSRTVQTALNERFGVWVSITHLNRVRSALGVSRHPQGVEKKSGPSRA